MDLPAVSFASMRFAAKRAPGRGAPVCARAVGIVLSSGLLCFAVFTMTGVGLQDTFASPATSAATFDQTKKLGGRAPEALGGPVIVENAPYSAARLTAFASLVAAAVGAARPKRIARKGRMAVSAVKTMPQTTGVSGRDPMGEPRYAGLGTFMRTPLVSDPKEVDIALVGVPYDGATEGRPGARHGPREIRSLSSFMRRMHQVTKVDPYELARVGDVGDVPFDRALEVEASHHQITEFYDRILNAGAVPLSAGGDHSVTLPILRAVAKANGGPVGLFHFDAHCDTYDSELGCKFSHGAPFRRAVEEGLIDPKRTIQVGIRGAGNSEEAWSFSLNSGMRVLFMEEAARIGIDAVIAEARRIVGPGPAYCTFDVDGLDPVYAPGTGTPEVGGFTTIDAQRILRGLRGLDFVGGDVVEVSPPFDHSGGTALVGATMMYEILCLLAEARETRLAQ